MNKKTIKNLTSRVKLGMKYLDKNKPGWENKINLKRLDIGNGSTCMLGQLFNGFWRNVNGEGEHDEEKMSRKDAKKYGFLLNTTEENAGYYDLLTNIWFTKIFNRLYGCN